LEAKLVDVLIYNNSYKTPLACSVDAALSVALKRIVEARAHRIYISDTLTHRARGVVTLTDIIRGIVREFTHEDALGDD
jgi:CBS domain containing-hemolysin-like protein